jgi:hypothetical protein
MVAVSVGVGDRVAVGGIVVSVAVIVIAAVEVSVGRFIVAVGTIAVGVGSGFGNESIIEGRAVSRAATTPRTAIINP